MNVISWIRVAAVCVMLALAAGTAFSKGQEQNGIQITYNSPDAWDRCTRDRFIQIPGSETGGARLARSWMIATEQGVTSLHGQVLTPAYWVRKTFRIELPRAQGAELWIFRGGGNGDQPMMIQFNGHAIRHSASNVRIDRGWQREPIPAEWLRPGDNEVIFSHAGQVCLDVFSPHAGSAISYDAGRTWHEVEGEYIVRLRVEGCAPRGAVTSDVIDAGRSLAPAREIGPWPRALRAAVAADADIPGGTSLAFQWRAGYTREVRSDQWTPWQDGNAIVPAQRRFLQWRVILNTRRADRTPLIRKVVVTLQQAADTIAPLPENIVEVRCGQPVDLSGSYPFTYETDTPRIRYLRDKYELSQVLPPEGADLARSTAVRNWVSRRWKNGWDWGKYQFVPPWDTLMLFEMAPPNYCLGMCTHYATAYVQSSAALGFVSRHLIVDYHCLAETYLDDLGRWVIQDPGPGAGPDGYPIGLIYMANGMPLNALEMHRILASGSATVQAVPREDEGAPWPYTPENNLWLYERFGIPLRNNHLSVPYPAEEEHGMDFYHFDGYLWWADNLDDPDEKVRCFSLLSNRPADFYPGVNSTWIDPEMTTDGVVRVSLSHNMPNWREFEIRIDGAEWKPSAAQFDWPLRAGRNTLAVRARNLFNLTGRPTTLEIDFAR